MSVVIIHSNHCLLESMANALEDFTPYIFDNLNNYLNIEASSGKKPSLVIVETNHYGESISSIYRKILGVQKKFCPILFIGQHEEREYKGLNFPLINYLKTPFLRSELQFKVDILSQNKSFFCFRNYYPEDKLLLNNIEGAFLVSGEIKLESVRFSRSFLRRTDLLEITNFKNIEILKKSEILIKIADSKAREKRALNV